MIDQIKEKYEEKLDKLREKNNETGQAKEALAKEWEDKEKLLRAEMVETQNQQ